MFKPSNALQPQEQTSREDFVQVEPEAGLQFVAVSLLVDTGEHKREPYVKTDNKGNEVIGDDGQPVMVYPKDCQQIAAFIDLLDDHHDYGEGIGKKQIRLPLHSEFMNKVQGINFAECAPFDAKGNYIKRPWTLAPSSMWTKLAGATKTPEIIDPGSFEAPNPSKSDVSLLLGKPFQMEVVVKKKKKEQGDGEWVNVYVKSPVPLRKGDTPPALEAKPLCIGLYDEDLMEKREDLGGCCKVDLIRRNVRVRIMNANNYEGSKMQEAFKAMGIDQGAGGSAQQQQSAQEQNSSEGFSMDAGEEFSQEEGNGKGSAQASPEEGFDDFDDSIPF